MSNWIQDFRYAFRQLRSHLRFTTAAVMTLALGIGATTAIYSLVHAVILKPLPLPEADRLVRVWSTHPERGDMPVSGPDFHDLRSGSRTFSDLAAVRHAPMTLVEGSEAFRLHVAAVSADFFSAVATRAKLGRSFDEGETRPGGEDRVVVLSHGLWQDRFGARPDVVGRDVLFAGQSRRVIGVMPEDFGYPSWAEAWIPLAIGPDGDRDGRDLEAFGRLRDGVTIDEARAELETLAGQLSERHPVSNDDWTVRLESLQASVVGREVKQGVLALFGAVGLLLLMACANVSNLLLVRATRRRREITIRSALGAGRLHLLRLLQIESLLLALAGGGLGFLFAWWSVPVLVRLCPAVLPRLDEVEVDLPVLVFAVTSALVSMSLATLLPAAHALRFQGDALRGGRSASERGRSLRETMASAQLALALVVMLGAGLMTRSFLRLAAVDPGFVPQRVLSAPVLFPEDTGADDRIAFLNRVRARLRDEPGVICAGATTTDPLRQGGFVNTVTPEQQASQAPVGGLVSVGWRSVTPGFFDTLGIPVLKGRPVEESDRGNAARVMVLTRNLAERLWPGEDPIGRGLYFGSLDGGDPYTVVGVVGDYRDVDLAAELPLVFVPYDQIPMPQTTLLVQVRQPSSDVAERVRQAVRSVAPHWPASRFEPLTENLSEALAAPRFNMLLFTLFATISLLLAAMGVYSILTYAVTQRTREIGIRMALGAAPRQVLRLFLGGGLRIAGAGIAVGVLGAWALTRFLEHMLYEIEATDPLTMVVAVSSLAIMSLGASWLPALRATRVDPKLTIDAGH